MSGQSFYLKPPGRPTRPGSLVSLIVRTVPSRAGEADRRCRLRVWAGASVAACRFRRGRWTDPITRSFGQPSELWTWIHTFAQTKGVTYVISPIASDSITVAGFWERIGRIPPVRTVRSSAPAGRVSRPRDGSHAGVRRMVLQGRPDIVQYSHGSKSVCWLSGRQYFDVETHELSGMLGTVARGEAGTSVRCLPEVLQADTDAVTWLRAMMKFSDWFYELNAGSFPKTIPNAAMQFFRANMSGRPILVNSDQETIDHERQAYFGGRATCWFWGDVVPNGPESQWPDWIRPLSDRPIRVGTVYHWDVRSTYPALLRDRYFPIRHIRTVRSASIGDCERLSKCYCCVANVLLETNVPEYPCRTEFDVIYPTGRFWTTLCGPELDAALSEGAVKQVGRFAWYVRGRPFALFAARVLGMREAAQDAKDKVWELMVKLLGNSLHGKLSQRPLGWVRCHAKDRVRQWGVDFARNADSGEVRKYRWIAGLAFERTELPGRNGTMLACSAFLTAYCRTMMRRIRESLPYRSVLSQDTDGLWVTAAAASVLRARFAERQNVAAGELEYRSQSIALRLLGPKHYHTDKGWVLAGYHRPQVSSKGVVRDSYVINPARIGTDEAPLGVREYRRRCNLAEVDPGGYVGDDGWLIPWRLPILPGDPPPVAPPAPPRQPELF